MNTIVKALNGKVENGKATNVVDALKQIDSNAKGETIAEVIENMEIGAGGGEQVHLLTATIKNVSMGALQNLMAYFPYENGFQIPTGELFNGSSATYKYLFMNAGEGCIVPCANGTRIDAFSNNVNCNVMGVGSNASFIVIVDPTKDASIMIDMNITGGSNS